MKAFIFTSYLVEFLTFSAIVITIIKVIQEVF